MSDAPHNAQYLILTAVYEDGTKAIFQFDGDVDETETRKRLVEQARQLIERGPIRSIQSQRKY